MIRELGHLFLQMRIFRCVKNLSMNDRELRDLSINAEGFSLHGPVGTLCVKCLEQASSAKYLGCIPFASSFPSKMVSKWEVHI